MVAKIKNQMIKINYFLCLVTLILMPSCDYSMKYGPVLKNHSNRTVQITVFHRDGVKFPQNSPVEPGKEIQLGRFPGSVKKVEIKNDDKNKFEINFNTTGNSNNAQFLLVSPGGNICIKSK